jgi:hypothetical protein
MPYLNIGWNLLQYNGPVNDIALSSHKKICQMEEIVRLCSEDIAWQLDVAAVVKAFGDVKKFGLLRKVLKPGIQDHCTICKAVWDEQQRVLHNCESCEPEPQELSTTCDVKLYWAYSKDAAPAQVLFVSDAELSAKIVEIREKQPMSIKKICHLLKAQKPEWLVTKARLKKLPKTQA